jgi:hypothetical protein
MSKKPLPKKEFRVSSEHYAANVSPRIEDCKAQCDCKTDSEVLEFLLRFWEENRGAKIPQFSSEVKPAGYDLTEQELVAFATQNLPFEQLIKKGVLAESKRLYSESLNTNPGRAPRSQSYERIDKVVRDQMAINLKGNFFEKRFMSTAWIQDKSKCNFKAIQEYLTTHESEIRQHHEKCGIAENHNRRVKFATKNKAKESAKEAAKESD